MIYLDMDGVLVDFAGGVMELFGHPRRHAQGIVSWDGIPAVLSDLKGRHVSAKTLWRKVADAGASFWAELPWLPWGREVYDLCREAGPVVLMTSPTLEPSCVAGKTQWIQSNMTPKQRNYCFSPCKELLAHPGVVLLDDGLHNVIMFKKNRGKAVLFPAPWNSYNKWPTRDQALAAAERACQLSK